jgi:hypothetical protein
MMTTRNLHGDAPAPLQQCPRCGHRGVAVEFAYALPGITQCQEQGKGTWFEVQFPDEEKPRRFAVKPSIAEIVRIVEELEASKGKRPRKSAAPAAEV